MNGEPEKSGNRASWTFRKSVGLKLRPVSAWRLRARAYLSAVFGLLTAEIDGVPASVDDVWAWGDRISGTRVARPDPQIVRAPDRF